MKTKFNGILTLLLAFMVQFTFAQERTISGTVSDDLGPVSDITVKVKGTDNGTVTDFDGNYTIKAKTGDVIEFTHISYVSSEKTVGASNTMDVLMNASGNVLDEVVVTAFGVKREKKTLGYAVTKISSTDIEQKAETDITRALNGKIAGVQITGSGGATGSSTNIRVRTSISVNGSNQPLYIVDGVPFEAGANNVAGFANGGTNASSRALDLNVDNIESISVLKGLSAASLYGAQGRNGVILITTKTGKNGNSNDKFEVSLTNTSYITKISNLPDYQNKYGQGADQTFNPGFVGNWGSEFGTPSTVIHPYANGRNPGYDVLFPQFFGIQVPYEAAPNNISDFFRDGFGTTTSVGVSNGNEKGNINFSYSNTKEDGYIQSNTLSRNTFSIGGNLKLNNKFNVGGTMNYVNTKLKTPPISAANATGAISIFQRLLYIPRNIDLGSLPFSNPLTGASVYYRPDLENPYWLLENSGDASDTRRVFGSFNVGYTFNDHISTQYTFGFDTFSDEQNFHVNRGGVARTEYQIGYLRTTRSTNEISNHRLLLNFNDYKFNEDISFNSFVGFESRGDIFSQDGVSSTNQIVFGRINHDNFVDHTTDDALVGDLQFDNRRNVYGVFAQADFGYKNYLYATFTGRNDFVSNLTSENRSKFYPSVSVSFIPSSAFKTNSENINFLKLRASYATSAGFASGYPVSQTLSSTANAFVDSSGSTTTNSLSSLKSNPNLKPEFHKEFEVGIEGSFFKKRINLDLSLYSRISEDQILNRSLPPSSGFTSTQFNAGRIDGEGIEIGLGIIPFKTKNFKWNIQNNFSASETEVISLPEDRIVYTGFTNLGNAAIVGQPLGVIVGSYYVRDQNGNILVDAGNSTTQGRYITSNDISNLDPINIIGDPNPDWRLTSINSFSYKNLTLSTQIEYVHGGDIYSNTALLLLLRGVTEDTIDRESTTILPGVLGDPTTGLPLLNSNGQPIQNSVQIGANDIYFQDVFRADEAAVFDGTTLRIRDISLSYKLPKKLLKKTPFGSLSFNISGQNLWYKAYNFPEHLNFDPEVLSTGQGNGAGLDFQTAPTTKRYSFSIKANF